MPDRRQRNFRLPAIAGPRIDVPVHSDAVADRLALQTEYVASLNVLPDSLHGSAITKVLQAIVDLDLNIPADTEPPHGYGRD